MTPSNPPASVLPWDTDFFGVRIARLNGSRLSPELASAARQWCEENAVDCLYFLADPEYETTREASLNGFHLVDIRVTLDLQIATAIQGSLKPGPYRHCQPDDVDALKHIARSSYHTRFHADPCFPDEQCDELYALWIERSCGDYADAVLVVPQNEQPAGFITCKVTRDGGQIGLVGVSSAMRGQGIGDRLIALAIDWFDRQGLTTASVVTQGNNIPAQRLYQKAGFQTRSMQLWYHRWFTKDEA